MSDHYVSLGETDDGWSMALCACGWASPPCPGPSEAADAYGDHRAAAAIAVTAAPIADAARAGVATVSVTDTAAEMLAVLKGVEPERRMDVLAVVCRVFCDTAGTLEVKRR